MKTIEEKYKLIAEIALAKAADKTIQCRQIETDGSWTDTNGSIQLVSENIMYDHLDYRVKPEPKTEQRRFFWANIEGRGLVLTEIHCADFHSPAIPTLGIDGLLTFEVPESE